jgi:hypothetical protein
MQKEDMNTKMKTKTGIRFFDAITKKRPKCQISYCYKRATSCYLHENNPYLCRDHKLPGMIDWEQMGKFCIKCISNYVESEKYIFNKNLDQKINNDNRHWKSVVLYGNFFDVEGKNRYCSKHRPEKYSVSRSLCIICTGKFLCDINITLYKIHFCPLHIRNDPIL